MRLATLKEYRGLIYTPTSAPSIATLRANIHQIPGGRKHGGRYYVDLDEFDRCTGITAKVSARLHELAKNPLLEGLL